MGLRCVVAWTSCHRACGFLRVARKQLLPRCHCSWAVAWRILVLFDCVEPCLIHCRNHPILNVIQDCPSLLRKATQGGEFYCLICNQRTNCDIETELDWGWRMREVLFSTKHVRTIVNSSCVILKVHERNEETRRRWLFIWSYQVKSDPLYASFLRFIVSCITLKLYYTTWVI